MEAALQFDDEYDFHQLFRGQVCAGYHTGGIDTCQGDSGGPLTCDNEDETHVSQYLHGITSYGYYCARASLYGVYTRPCFFMDWIKETINGEGGSFQRRGGGVRPRNQGQGQNSGSQSGRGHRRPGRRNLHQDENPNQRRNTRRGSQTRRNLKNTTTRRLFG